MTNDNLHVFLSYARDDDEPFVKRLYGELTCHGVTVWWDRQAMESRGRTFLQEIRDAIEQVDRVLVVIGPKAVTSEYVRYEWDHALLFAKAVIPLLRFGDFVLVPESLSRFHSVDCRSERPEEEALQELLRLLAEPVPALGPFLTEVPRLPPHFLARKDDLRRLEGLVLADLQRSTVITSAKQTAALQGMGGIGKSVLAAAFARSTGTRHAFTDGILWLTARPADQPHGSALNLVANLGLVGKAFGDDPAHYTEESSARARLPTILQDKVCLIVLDDAWSVAQAEPFINAAGPRCRLLVTTRDGGLVTALGAEHHSVDVLSEEQALWLLAEWSKQEPAGLPAVAREVAGECGFLPLALAMVGAMVRDKPDRWANALGRLRNADLDKLKRQFPNYPYLDLLRALGVSVDALDETPGDRSRRDRYLDFAVFPERTPIPEAVLQTLWKPLGIDDLDAQDLIDLFVERSLAHRDDRGRLSLHDLQLDYVRKQTGDLRVLHRRLLDTYRGTCTDGWGSGPDDGYFFQRLPWHLKQAGDHDLLRALLGDIAWMRGKLRATDVYELLADYDDSDDAALGLIKRALLLSAGKIFKDKAQLESQLVGRLRGFNQEEIRDFVARIESETAPPWICPLSSSLVVPGGSLLAILVGHEGSIISLVLTPDGSRVISLAFDGTLRIWNTETGKELHCCQAHQGFSMLRSLAVSPDGSRVVSAASDRSIRVWDVTTGHALAGWTVPSQRDIAFITNVGITPDGAHVVAMVDKAMQMWDLATGDPRIPQSVENLQGVTEILQDGYHIIAGEKIVDFRTGAEVGRWAGHEGGHNCLAMTPDAARMISGGKDGTIAIHDVGARKVICSWQGHKDPPRFDDKGVSALVVLADGSRLVSASYDKTLRVWDLNTGTEIGRCYGEGHISCAAVTADGTRAVSGGDDWTVRIWDLNLAVGMGPREERIVSSVAVTPRPDISLALSGSDDGWLELWNTKTGAQIGRWHAHEKPITTVGILWNGQRAISGDFFGNVGIWDLNSYQLLAQYDVKRPVTAVLLTGPDGSVAYAGSKGALRGWDMNKGDEWGLPLPPNDSLVHFDIWQNPMMWICRSENSRLSVWDLLRGPIDVWDEIVTAVGIRPGGMEAVLGCQDGTVRIWDLQQGQQTAVCGEHERYVCAVAADSFGHRAVSSAYDRTIRVWDLTTRHCLATFSSDFIADTLELAPDGLIVASSGDGSLHLLKFVG